LNIGKKGGIAIFLFFIVLAVVLGWDMSRNALFNGLGMLSVTLQTWVVGAYTAITTNAIWLQWQGLIAGVTFSILTAFILVSYYHGKFNKLKKVLGQTTTAKTAKDFTPQTSPAIPESAPIKTEEKEVIAK